MWLLHHTRAGQGSAAALGVEGGAFYPSTGEVHPETSLPLLLVIIARRGWTKVRNKNHDPRDRVGWTGVFVCCVT